MTRRVLLAVAATLVACTAAYAHHSYAATYDVTREIKLEGKLVWNLETGRAQSIEWSSKGNLKLTVAGKAKQPDGTEVDA